MTCLIDADFDDQYEPLYCKMVKGRRNWCCGECNTIISKGKEHEVFVGKIDDRINTHRTCLTCLSIRNKFCCNWTFEGMYEDIENAIDGNPDLENCILMMATEKEYNKLSSEISSLMDEEDDDLED